MGTALRWVAGVLVAGACTGCMSHVVHERAVADLGCDDVQIEHVAGGTFEATGCGRSATYTCVTQAWSSGTCVHDDDPSQGSPATRTAAPVATGQTSSARHAPPASAGGFELGITDAQARAACETAGHVYATKAASSSCDGLPTEVGQPAEARLRFCASKLCRVTLVIQRPSETLEQSLVRWKRALVDKYGGQTATENQIPSDCKDLASCVAAHRATVSVEWTWPTGEGIALSVVNTNGDGGDNPDGVVVRVSYSKDAPNGL